MSRSRQFALTVTTTAADASVLHQTQLGALLSKNVSQFLPVVLETTPVEIVPALFQDSLGVLRPTSAP